MLDPDLLVVLRSEGISMRTLVYAFSAIAVLVVGAYLGYANSVSLRSPRHIYPTTWQALVAKGNKNATQVTYPADQPGVIRTTLKESFPDIHDVSISNYGIALTGPGRRRVTFQARSSAAYTAEFALIPTAKPGLKFQSIPCEVTSEWKTFAMDVDAPAEGSPYSFTIFLGKNPGPLTFDLQPITPDIQSVTPTAP